MLLGVLEEQRLLTSLFYQPEVPVNSPHFMEPEGLLPHSQSSATYLYPGPAQSSPHTHITRPGDPS